MWRLLNIRQLNIIAAALLTIMLAACGGGGSSSSSSSGSGGGGSTAIASITVSPTSVSIAVGAAQQFMATAMDSSGNTISGVSFTWASSSAGVATISSTGLATGVAAGSTNVTASASGVTSTAAALTVSPTLNGGFSVWVSNGGDSTSVSSVTEVTSAAVSAGSCTSATCITFTGGAMNGTGPLTVDANGNIWVVNQPIGAPSGLVPYSVTEITAAAVASGNCSSTTCLNYTGAGLYGLEDIAVDMNGNAWVADSCPEPTNFAAGACGIGNGGVTEIKPGAAQDCSSGCVYFTIQEDANGVPQLFPQGVTVDTQGNVWFTNDGCLVASNCPTNTGSIVEIPLSSIQAGSCSNGCTLYFNGNIADPRGVAIDILGDAWIANECGPANCLNFFGGSVTEVKKGATLDCTSGCVNFTGGGLFQPDAVAIDNTGNVWVTNPSAPGITEIGSVAIAGGACTSTSCLNFNVGSIEGGRKALAIDPSGDVWVVARQELQEIVPGAATDCSSGCIAFTLSQLPLAVAVTK